jgi:hypothetical protein
LRACYMNPDDAKTAIEFITALGSTFGPVAAVLLWLVYTAITARKTQPAPSRLEMDVQRMSERQEQMMRELHTLASDVARIEGRLDGK